MNFIRNIIGLIPRCHHKATWRVLVLQVLYAALECFTLATFLPVIIILLSSEGHPNELLKWLADVSTIESTTTLAWVMTSCVLVAVILKTYINTTIAFKTARYAYEVAGNIASISLGRFMQQPYQRFADSGSAVEMNKISNQPLKFANNILIPSATLIGEGVVTIVLFIGMMVIDVKLVGLLLAVILPMSLLFIVNRKRIKSSGDEIKVNYPQVLSTTSVNIDGFIEIRAFRKQSFFQRKFEEAFHNLSQTFSKDYQLQTGMSRISELTAALIIAVLIVYLLSSKATASESAMIISIFSGSILRLLPAVNRIFTSITKIKSNEYVVEELREMARLPKVNNPAGSLIFRENIEISNLSFYYDERNPILRNVSLRIQRSERIIISGKSGSGKSTLLHILLGLLRKTNGEIKVDGRNTNDEMLHRLMGYVPQTPYLLDASIVANIAFGVPENEIDLKKINNILLELDLLTAIETFPDKELTIIGERGIKISGGQRQRIAIARALYHDAQILLLDEVTNQLDEQTEAEIMKIFCRLQSRGIAIVQVTHKTAMWDTAERVYELNDGRLLEVSNQNVRSVGEISTHASA